MGVFKSKSSKSGANGRKTIIAQGCQITGELINPEGSLHVDGQIDGIIETDNEISIGCQGKVKGLVKAQKIVVSGTLEGKIVCEKVEVLATGKLLGDIVCGEILIEAGGKFIGKSSELTEGGMIVSFSEIEKKELANQTSNLESKR
jgi:cytoskeletal protein CcmA (bactofilin family)